MPMWKYNIEMNGKQLREAINKDQTIETIVMVYDAIISCLNSLKKKLGAEDKEGVEYEIEEMIEDLQCACPDINDCLDYDEEEQNVNLYLTDFYDFCDRNRVWIGA